MKPNSHIHQAARRGLAAAGALIVLALSGCTSSSMLQPASENAQSVANLTWAMLGLAALVFVVVETMLVVTIIRWRRKRNAGLPAQVTGNTALEIGWTAFPAIILAIIFVLTLGTLRFLTTPPEPPAGAAGDPTQVLNVTVIGHEWWWEFKYDDLGFTTANELHVPVGATVNLNIESGDVIHSFWVPEMGGKQDAVPGHINFTWWKVTKAGQFHGQCAEYCGTEHALMRILVVSEPADQFTAWVNDQKAAPVLTDLSAQAQQGQQVFMSHACIACHTIQGTKAVGVVGPNLTHFASRSVFAGASFDNTPANVASWVQNPQAMKPGNHMPVLGLTNDQAAQVAAFLESLK